MRHFDDSALSHLLAGQLNPREVRAYGQHVRECARCTRRFEGWRGVFPQIESLLDSAPPAPVVMLPNGPTLILPDRDSQDRLRRRLRRVQVLSSLLVVAVIGLLVADHYGALSSRLFAKGVQQAGLEPDPPADVGSASADSSSQTLPPPPLSPDSTAVDTAGNSAIAPPETTVVPRATVSAAGQLPLAHVKPSEPRAPEAERVVNPVSSPTVVTAAKPSVRPTESAPDPPVRSARGDFPTSPPADPAGTSGEGPARTTVLAFDPVSLEAAILHLGGHIREIAGLQRVSLESGPGALVDGARADQEVIRIRYLAPDSTTVTLDIQRLSSGQADASPRVAIARLPDGNLIARWTDPVGLWLSLSAVGDRPRMLSLANSVR